MRSSVKAWFRLAAVAMTLALVIPVLSMATAAQDDGKVLRVMQEVYPEVVPPRKSSSTTKMNSPPPTSGPLTRQDTNQETVPAAAESWEYNGDATQITFHLRPDLKYSDGSPLTAENFRYAVQRTCDPVTAGEYQSILFEITGCADFAGLAVDEEGNAQDYTPEEYEAARAALGVTAIDDLTLQIDLANPAPYFHTVAALWVFYPVKQEIVDANSDTWWQSAENHIGNGPFNIASIDEEQRWTFAANENYWEGRPKLDGIEYRYVEDAAVALEAYRAGDLDIVQLEPPQIPEVQADPELSEAYVTYPTASSYNLSMNLTLEPFTDLKVREAFAYAFDRETHCVEVRLGDCTPTLSWIPEGVPGAIESEKYGFDPDAATQALA